MSKQDFIDLKNWINSNGGFIHPFIDINNDDLDNRYLIASNNIEDNELIIRIPNELLIEGDEEINALNSDEYKQVFLQIQYISSLIKEYKKENKSFYYHYFKMLPPYESYFSLPVYQLYEDSSNEIKWKSISKMTGYISKQLDELNSIIKFFEEYFPEYTREQVIRFYFVINTRSWGGENKYYLVPLADLLIHSNDATMSLSITKNEKFLNSTKVYKAGEAIILNYGIQDDLLLYCKYGFIDQNSKLKLIGFHPMISSSNNFIDKLINDLLGKVNKRFYISNLGIPLNLLKYLRLGLLTQSNLTLLDLSNKINEDKIFSLDNEFNVLRYLISQLLDKSIYPTKEMLEFSTIIINNRSTEIKSSVEYHLAKLNLILVEVLYYSVYCIGDYWIKQIGLDKYVEVQLNLPILNNNIL